MGRVGQGAGRKELDEYYPEGSRRRDADRISLGADDPVRGTWLRGEVPLMRSLWLAKKPTTCGFEDRAEYA